MNFKDAIDSLSNEQAGCVFKGLFHYVCYGKLPNCDAVSKAVLLIFKSSIDEAKRRYEERCKQNKSNADKRWGNDIQTDANECECIQTDANECECMPNEYDYEYDKRIKENSSNQRLECKKSDDFSPEIRFNFDSSDFVRVQNMWNRTCTGYRKVTKLTSKSKKRCNRKGKIVACLKMIAENEATKEAVFEVLQNAFNKVSKSKFLSGDNQKKWRADFDWVMRQDNLEKIIEGNYDSCVNAYNVNTFNEEYSNE